MNESMGWLWKIVAKCQVMPEVIPNGIPFSLERRGIPGSPFRTLFVFSFFWGIICVMVCQRFSALDVCKNTRLPGRTTSKIIHVQKGMSFEKDQIFFE